MLHGGLAAVVPGENTPNLIDCISAAEFKRKKDVCSCQIYESGFQPPPPPPEAISTVLLFAV